MKKLGIILLLLVAQIAAKAEGNTNNFNAVTAKGDTLFGTLQMPVAKLPTPNVVLIIAGSGPTDRDCNSMMGLKTDAFKMLADSLANAGIASVRYDKRGVGDSKNAVGKEEDMRFDDMVADAVIFVKKIKADKQFAKVLIAGHSEGSLIGMLAAQKEKIDGYISIAGPGEDAGTILSKQIKTNAPQLSEESDKIIASLRSGKMMEAKDATVASVFRTSVQPYMISWMAYDPQEELNKLSIPVLIIQGNTDLQVSVADAQLLKKAMPAAKLVIIDQMNHPLKTVSSDKQANMATYSKPELPIDSDFCQVLIGFCKK